MMNTTRLQHLLDGMRTAAVAIVGDFFLDDYMIIDPRLEEPSIETGLPAHQVIELRPSPGAAGSVSTKVAALEIGTAWAVTMLGDDGHGYDLGKLLAAIDLRLDHVVRRPDRFTPTYGKPMLRRPNGTEEEINRIDVKNRQTLPAEVEDAVIRSMRVLAPGLDGLVVIDQVEEPNCGVITGRVRDEIARLGDEYSDLAILADSRNRIGRFRNVMIKPNFSEAAAALGKDELAESDENARTLAGQLSERTRRPVFLTMGPAGIIVADSAAGEVRSIPAPRVQGMIDTTGAGDTVTAGVVAALCADADVCEASAVGNLAASITIRQLGTTGTATPQQMLQALETQS
jgi:rfaE bifunctional protein kinase chain/domain